MTNTIFVCQHCGKTSKMEGFKVVEENDSSSTKSAPITLSCYDHATTKELNKLCKCGHEKHWHTD